LDETAAMTEVFHIVPGAVRGSATLLLLMPVVVILVVLGIIGYSLITGARSSTFEVSSAGLRLRGDFYGRMIPANELRLGEVKRVDINSGPYHPTMRTMGTAMPGYRGGWFRLRNGHKALLYVTDPSNVVLVPTTAGYDVLLSVVDPERFVERLGALAGSSPSRVP
jgi:hypothetical protein